MQTHWIWHPLVHKEEGRGTVKVDLLLGVRMASLSLPLVSFSCATMRRGDVVVRCSPSIPSQRGVNFNSAWWQRITCIINIIFALWKPVHRVCILTSPHLSFTLPHSLSTVRLFINSFWQVVVFTSPPLGIVFTTLLGHFYYELTKYTRTVVSWLMMLESIVEVKWAPHIQW